MYKFGFTFSVIFSILVFVGCSDNKLVTSPKSNVNSESEISSLAKGATTANGWYEEQEIYYIDAGVEEGISERGKNQIYLIGGNRMYQAQVVLFVPGEAGYSPHWNVSLVNTAMGKTTADIVSSPYVSAHYPEALFDDVEDILGAEAAGLVTITKPGIVVLCPIVSEKAADAPGNTALSEKFTRPWPNEF